jgi:hypothetical protein
MSVITMASGKACFNARTPVCTAAPSSQASEPARVLGFRDRTEHGADAVLQRGADLS